MKTKRIDLRASAEDSQLIIKASKKLHPGRKYNQSRTIRSAIEMAADAQPELFFCNRVALHQVDANIEKGAVKLQTVVDEFKAVTAGKVLTMTELENFVFTGSTKYMAPKFDVIREFVVTKLIEGKAGEVAGLQLSEAKLRELVVLPELSNLMSAVADIGNVPLIQWREAFYWPCYHIAEGIVTIVPEQVETAKNMFRCYAATSDERTKLAKVRNLCRALDSFLDDRELMPSRLGINGVCYFDSESRRFEPAEYYIKYGLKN